MKNLFTVVLIAVSAIAWSQNWQPVNPDYTYFYKTAEDEFISNTVLVDSVGETNGQQVYYLNTIRELCDTCENIDCFFSGFDYYITDYPNFLQKEIYPLNGDKTIFKNENSFVIFQNSGLNQSWLFDTLQNITASVVQISFDEIFPGIYDSVKTIQLSNSHLIKLAKNHGILEYPDFYYSGNSYYLQGGRTPDGTFGEEVLNYKNIFVHEVGDIYCESYANVLIVQKPMNLYSIWKREVIYKEVLDDKIIYGLFVKRKDWNSYNSPPPTYYQYYDTLIVNNSSLNPYNTLPGTSTKSEQPQVASLGLDTSYNALTLILKNRLIKCDLYDNIYYDEQGTLTTIYAEGFGLIYKYTRNEADWEQIFRFEGLIRNGDTIGEIYPDSIFLTTSIKKIAADDIHVFPVPASQTINIILPRYQNECLLELLDMRTRVLLKKTFRQTSEMKLDISNIEKGVYLLKIQFNNQTYLKKIIKS